MTCWMRWTFDENVATMMRLRQLWNALSNAAPTVLSLGVWPSRSEFVESAIMTSTPLLPSSEKRRKSVILPSIGV